MEIEGGAIDLGEAAAETVALALDPFPRSARAAEVLRAAGVISEDDVVPIGGSDRRGKKGKTRRKGRQSLSTSVTLGKDELVRQTHEIIRDKENLHVRRVSRGAARTLCCSSQGRCWSTMKSRRLPTKLTRWTRYVRSWGRIY